MAAEDWSAVTWEGARRAQLRDQARLTPEERLRWLEEALELASRWEPREGAALGSPDPGDDPETDELSKAPARRHSR